MNIRFQRATSTKRCVPTLNFVLCMATAFFALLSSGAVAQTCSEGKAALSGLKQAFDSWEARAGSLLSIPLRVQIAVEMCDAAAGVVEDGLASVEAIDKVLPKVLGVYLDSLMQSLPASRTVGATLRKEFNVGGGLAKPQFRRLVRVDVRYQKDVDVVDVAGDVYPKPTALALPAGNGVALVGRKQGNKTVVCKDTLDLVGGKPAEFVCK